MSDPPTHDGRAPIRTLGTLAIDGGTSTHGKALLLLAYLSLNGPQPRKRLAALFWPSATDPLNRLSVTLRRLNGSVPGAVVADHQGAATAWTTDAQFVADAIKEGRRDDALAQYQGAFLEGVYVPGLSTELEEWIVATRDALIAKVQVALLEGALTLADELAYDLAAARAEAVLHVDASLALLQPVDLARLHDLLASGGSPLARTTRSELAGLGIDVDLDTGAARERLRRAGARRPVPTNLRAHPTSFFGREREREELARLLARPDHRLVTIVGPGGMGKTRLALRVAEDLLESMRFPDGVYDVPLGQVARADAIAVAIAEALGVPLPPSEPALDALAHALRGLRQLIVLDNLEHLHDASEVIDELIRGCPDVTFLATSRDRIGSDAEWLVPIAPLAHPSDAPEPTDARAWSAIALFEARAQRIAPAFRAAPDDVAAIANLCRMTGGSPLALELAAGHVSVMPVAHIVEAIRTDLDFLQTTRRNGPDRHRSLRVVFEQSWARLHHEDREALLRLAVCSGFTREAALAVAAATPRVLTSLVAQSLIVPIGRGRFERHPLLQQYTAEKLKERPDVRATARARHADWIQTLADEVRTHLNTRAGSQWLDRLEAEHANVRHALAWADERDDGVALARLLNALADFWIRRGHVAEARRWFAALERRDDAAIGDVAAFARALLRSAFTATIDGDGAAPRRLAERALALYERAGDAPGQAAARSHLGVFAVYQLRFDEAAAHYQEALAIARRAADVEGVGRVLNNLGDVAAFQGDLVRARSWFEASLATFRALGDDQMVSNVLGSLAMLTLEEREPEAAHALLVESVARVRDLGIAFSLPLALAQSARVATALGRPLDAARLWGAAEAQREAIRARSEPFDLQATAAWQERARQHLLPDAFDAAWAEGRTLSPEAAIALALTPLATPSDVRSAAS